MLVGQHCEAYQLQIALTMHARAIAFKLQDLIEATTTAQLIRLPLESLHVTVLPLIDADERLARAPADIWADECDRWIAAIDQAVSPLSPFMLELNQIAFLDRAVVMLGPSSTLHRLRAALAPGCGLPERPPRIPMIVHVSLFRYAETPMQALPGDTPAELQIAVTNLRLVRENVYPSLDVTVLQEFSLNGREGTLDRLPS